MPDLVHISRVEDIQVDALLPWIRRRKPRGILLGGGSPCQGNSSLNLSRQGLDDPRSWQPQHLCRLRDELAAHPECSEIELVTFLENVASMPSQVLEQYSSWIKAYTPS